MDRRSSSTPGSNTRILERVVVKVCVTRLIVLSILLLPLFFTWMWEELPRGILTTLTPRVYALFIAAGFGLNILYLLAWPRVQKIILFFRAQMITDLLMSSVLVFITGGVKSGFVFILLGLCYLYGRTLGYRTGRMFAIISAAVLLVCGIVQYISPQLWNYNQFLLNELVFTYSLQLLALGLILVLILMKQGRGQEQQLIQDLHSKERALRQAQILKSMVFDWIESGLLVLDEQGNISAINRQAAIWGQAEDPRAALGRPLQDFFPSFARLWEEYRTVPSDRLEVYERDGAVLFGLRITPLPDRGGLIIFSDITPVRRLENRVRNMEKFAAIGELAAGLAHEMKNPLAGIKASLQLIVRGDLEGEYAHRLNQVILRDIDRLDGLLKNFLAFARPSVASPQSFAVLPVVKENVSIFQPRFPRVEVTIDSGLEGKIWDWDKNQFVQVFLNLLLNAFEAVNQQEAPRIEILFSDTEQDHCLTIRDNGPGISPDTSPRIFDPFYTTKETGTGLGLSIAQRLASQNSSWIELTSRNGSGTDARIHYQPGQKSTEAESTE